jgi:thiol-disulfide isomerase/thioredoxin
VVNVSALEVIFVTKGDCPNCNAVRAVLGKVHHEYRHVEVAEVDPDGPTGRSLAAEYGIRLFPALIVNGHLRLAGEISEKDIRHEIQKARPHIAR